MSITSLLSSRVALLLATLGASSSWTPAPDDIKWTKAQPRQVEMIMGVNTHFGVKSDVAAYDPGTSAQFLRMAGFTSFRDSMSVPRLDMVRRAMPQQMRSLARLRSFDDASATGRRSVLAISGWDRGSAPFDLLVERYASAITSALPFLPPSGFVEIWNEWDKGDGTNGTVESYAALARKAIPAIRQADPGARILIGAAADDKGGATFAWTRSLLLKPEINAADGLSVHIYNHCSMRQRARAGADMIGRLDALHEAMAAAGHAKLPLYITETGWPTGEGRCLVDAEDVASNIAQVTLLAASRPWIAGLWYYELKDSGTQQDNPESHFGLLDYRGAAKPGACVARMTNRLIRQGRITGTYEGVDFTAVKLMQAGRTITVAWATNAGKPVSLPVKASYRPLCQAPVTSRAVQLSYRPAIFEGDLLAGFAE